MTGPASILIVDDELVNRRVLEVMLRPEGYETTAAASGPEALACIAEDAPDLILLDMMMPGIDGNEVATILKADPATRHIPVIMLTAQPDREARLCALDAGAEDFLTKPVDRAELWLRVRNHLRLKSLGDQVSEHSAHLESEVRARTADLHHQANYDALTGLPNRMLFYETLTDALRRASSRGWTVVVMFLDIDNFKTVNDTLGHAIGDDLLIQIGRRLVGCVRIRDTVGRLGGDEFALILNMEHGAEGATAVAREIQAALQDPFELGGHEVTVTVSIGITAHPDDACDTSTLIRYADTAMYTAKKAGRNTFRFFTPEMSEETGERLELETALRGAIRQGEFVLHYQPKVLLDRGAVCGLEALLRWDRPGHGLVPPDEFIPMLEETGLIVEVGRWAIESVGQQIARWQQSAVGPMQVSVNVSGRQFVDGDLEADVVRTLESTGIPAHLLELELTESTLMSNTCRTVSILQNLKARGVRISIDDFGTGYSSLAYLQRFPIDTLKIDISFVRDITTQPDDATIALAIIRMGHNLNLDVIAEGVETTAQLEYLRRHRCDEMQGYLFSPPLALAPLEELLLSGRRLASAPEGESYATLLIVDDNPDHLVALELLLTGEGYDVIVAASAAEGFTQLASHQVQVILCDQKMPGQNGTEFLTLVKQLHPDALRIMLSGADDVGILDTINSSEVYRYYTKPWDAETLRRNIREAFRHYWRLHELAPTDAAVAAPVSST